MEWHVKQAIACPDTGTAFVHVSCMRNLNLILWYRGDYFLRAGNILSTSPFGLIANGKKRDLEIVHASPYNTSLWDTFINNADCPGNTHPLVTECSKKSKCLFENCPYGVAMSH